MGRNLSDTEVSYMIGQSAPIAGSVPVTTSVYLDSPLFSHAYTVLALRRFGGDVAITYDIPAMLRGIQDVTDHEAQLRAIAEERDRNSDFSAWLARRRIGDWSVGALEPYHDGTLGACIRDFVVNSGMAIDFLHQNKNVANDFEYILKRVGQSHDIQHMVTGFGPNIVGEQALALMNVTANSIHFGPDFAQMMSLANLFTSSGTYMRSGLHYPAGMQALLEAMEIGIAAGREIKKPLVLVDWEDYLDWPVEDIAEDLGFKRGPGAVQSAHDPLLTG